MSHEIDMSNGRANMAYVGNVPWHGLGEQLKKGASIEKWRKAAGMDWTVERAPAVYQVPGSDELREVTRREVLYRSDNGESLGVVAPRFKPVQPGEVLEFYRDLVKAAGFELETAGCLKGGALYWALARTGDSFKVAGSTKDQVNSYVLLATGNDGTMATQARMTSVRVVCWNTLSYATADEKSATLVKVPHSRTFDADQVKQDLSITHEAFAEFHERVEVLAGTPVKEDEQFQMLADLYYPDREDDDAKMVHVYRTLECIEDGPGANLKGTKNTLWGTVNGVTRYLDHDRKSASDELRMRKAWFGDGEAIKQSIWDMALKQATAEKVAA